MALAMENQKCLSCGEELVGRIDKKFCDAHCRNSYNNSINRKTNALIRKVNSTLKRNQKILATLNPDGKRVVRKQDLIDLGFNFKYHTETFETKNGRIYIFCYDQGYLELENDKLSLVERKEWI